MSDVPVVTCHIKKGVNTIPNRTRNNNISIRVSDDELHSLKSIIQKSKLPLRELILDCVLKKEKIRECHRALQRICESLEAIHSTSTATDSSTANSLRQNIFILKQVLERIS